jgi:hypothetical protein
MAYQYQKDLDLPSTESGADDPYRSMFENLTGIKLLKPPRRLAAYNVYSKHNFDTHLKPLVDARCASEPKKKRVNIVHEITRAEYSKLTDEEKEGYEQEAKRMHAEALAEYEMKRIAPPSRLPEDQQWQVEFWYILYDTFPESVFKTRCIQGLVKFVQPILDQLSDHLGWKVSLVAGGPEPADGGRLNIVG